MKKIKKSWFNGKTVVITGVTSGIGFELCRILLENYGCKVIGLARRKEKLLKIKEELGDAFSFFEADISKKQSWENVKNQLEKQGIIIDVLINNAGVIHKFERLVDLSDETIETVINTNFYSVIYSLKTFLPQICKNNGRVLTVCSAASLLGFPGMSVYSASKAAVSNLMLSVRLEVPKKVFLGCAYPGFIKTELFDDKGAGGAFKESDKDKFLKFAMSAEKAAKKIIKGIEKKKPRKLIGLDCKLLNFCAKIMPVTTSKVAKSVLKRTKTKTFDKM